MTCRTTTTKPRGRIFSLVCAYRLNITLQYLVDRISNKDSEKHLLHDTIPTFRPTKRDRLLIRPRIIRRCDCKPGSFDTPQYDSATVPFHAPLTRVVTRSSDFRAFASNVATRGVFLANNPPLFPCSLRRMRFHKSVEVSDACVFSSL